MDVLGVVCGRIGPVGGFWRAGTLGALRFFLSAPTLFLSCMASTLTGLHCGNSGMEGGSRCVAST